MGDVAASGGYYIAMAADVIVAEPATITGSIGVLGGKLQTSGLLHQFGLNVQKRRPRRTRPHVLAPDGLQRGRVGKARRVARLRLRRLHEQGRRGRDMSREAVHEIARGRVWTGADALERGLVDEMGGLRRAVGDRPRTCGPADRCPAAPGARRAATATAAPSAQQRRPGLLRTGPDARRRSLRMGRSCPPGTSPRIACGGPAPRAGRAAGLSGHGSEVPGLPRGGSRQVPRTAQSRRGAEQP